MGKSFKRMVEMEEKVESHEFHEAKSRLELESYMPEEDDGYEDISHLIDNPQFYRTIRGA